MNEEHMFLNFDGLDDHEEKELLMHLRSKSINPSVKFPWYLQQEKVNTFSKGDGTFLNVFAPSFQSSVISNMHGQQKNIDSLENSVCLNNYSSTIYGSHSSQISADFKPHAVAHLTTNHSSTVTPEVNGNCPSDQYMYQKNVYTTDLQGIQANHSYTLSLESHISMPHSTGQVGMSLPRAPFPNATTSSNFKLSPTVSSFVPQNIPGFVSQAPSSRLSSCTQMESKVDSKQQFAREVRSDIQSSAVIRTVSPEIVESSTQLNGYSATEECNGNTCVSSNSSCNNSTKSHKNDIANCDPVAIVSPPISQSSDDDDRVVPSVPRSFADVLKSQNEKISRSDMKKLNAKHNENIPVRASPDSGEQKSCIKEDRMAIILGRYLYNLQLDFTSISLQPRGLINRRNWCYINATLQALLACSPFYSLLRNLPIGPGVERGTSSTPVIDSMVKLSYEFMQLKEEHEDVQPGLPFQPVTVYDMLGILKSDCLKGLQEDAEEFLSYILNGMHEEMVSVIKNYEEEYSLNRSEDMKSNGHAELSDGEEEWQVIGVKQRGMVTRKVVEHKTPISDLLGGQIKSFLTTNGNKTSASVQPFFTLQLDIQSENVTSVEEALNQMTVREPIQGYTCTKTKQEVEAYSRILLQKLPPVLILHLKRFVYNRNGGCKKVMKHTEYPINLVLKKELFAPEAKRSIKSCSYKLFAVMYHTGAEAVIGHYISDIYHHASKNWIRCDDRTITTITEAQVLSHSPSKVPYLLFYQVCSSVQGNTD